ncbi:MAG: hypothetical protein CMA10_00105 [Euryarchaeota archaeon]|nr:hypothetical protein [Euryarchaeota archaeon]|tara:strand:- start:422 stop:1420 length:999 start_codon:yes stop_codon:yes gene_type:complete
MRGQRDEAKNNPDSELREQLQSMESKVRKMRENRNSYREQGKAIAQKRNAVQEQYRDHKKKLDLMKAELDAIHGERNLHKAKRDTIQAQLRELIGQAKGRRNEKGEKKSATAEFSHLMNEIKTLEEKFQTTSSSTKKEKETMERIKRMKRRVEELEPEVVKFEMVSVDLSNLDEAISTLKSEADDAHKMFVEALKRADEKWAEYKEGLDHRNFLKAEGDRHHLESVESHEKANNIHAKIEELMVDVNKAREQLNLAVEERKSWMSDHNNAVKAEMKTGAESDEVAESLVQSLLKDGELMFGGLGKSDTASSSRNNSSSKKKNMQRLGPIRRR